MTSIDEGYLCFEFDSTWDHIEKWDGSPAFIDGIQCVSGIDALDIVAFSRHRQVCLLIEIKDFRDQNDQARFDGDRKPKKPRKNAEPAAPTEPQVAAKLTEQVAQKLAGTVAGLVGAARMRDEPFASALAGALTSHRSAGFKVRVVLWIEGEPTSKGKSPRNKVNLATLTSALKRKVNWLTKHPVQVLSTVSPPAIPGLTVIDNRS
jgi:hypothetical protein